MINKVLAYACLFLLAVCVFLVFLVIHKNTVITSQERSIEHGARIQRVRLEMDSTEAARIERERQRTKVLEVEYERLKAINTNLPIPKAPKTSKAMHEAILRAAKTE